MSVNVRTQNVTDATVQVHIAFENAHRSRGKRKRATRIPNTALLRNHKPQIMSVGHNKAEHRSDTKSRRMRRWVARTKKRAPYQPALPPP